MSFYIIPFCNFHILVCRKISKLFRYTRLFQIWIQNLIKRNMRKHKTVFKRSFHLLEEKGYVTPISSIWKYNCSLNLITEITKQKSFTLLRRLLLPHSSFHSCFNSVTGELLSMNCLFKVLRLHLNGVQFRTLPGPVQILQLILLLLRLSKVDLLLCFGSLHLSFRSLTDDQIFSFRNFC